MTTPSPRAVEAAKLLANPDYIAGELEVDTRARIIQSAIDAALAEKDEALRGILPKIAPNSPIGARCPMNASDIRNRILAALSPATEAKHPLLTLADDQVKLTIAQAQAINDAATKVLFGSPATEQEDPFDKAAQRLGEESRKHRGDLSHIDAAILSGNAPHPDTMRLLLKHILDCFSTAKVVPVSNDPLNGQISPQTFNFSRAALDGGHVWRRMTPNEPSKLTPEERRARIAEAYPSIKCLEGIWHWGCSNDTIGPICCNNDPLNDLNAMHSAEKTLTDEQYSRYADLLYDLQVRENIGNNKTRWLSPAASQRANALLLCLDAAKGGKE